MERVIQENCNFEDFGYIESDKNGDSILVQTSKYCDGRYFVNSGYTTLSRHIDKLLREDYEYTFDELKKEYPKKDDDEISEMMNEIDEPSAVYFTIKLHYFTDEGKGLAELVVEESNFYSDMVNEKDSVYEKWFNGLNEKDIEKALKEVCKEYNSINFSIKEGNQTNMSIKDKKGAYEFKNSNLRFHGMKMDINGNPCFVLSTPNQRAFSVQQDPAYTIYWELGQSGESIVEKNYKDSDDFEKYIVDYIKKFGSKKQKSNLHVYNEGNRKIGFYTDNKGNKAVYTMSYDESDNECELTKVKDGKKTLVARTKIFSNGKITTSYKGGYDLENCDELHNDYFDFVEKHIKKDNNFACGKGNFSVKEQKVVAFVWNKKRLNSSYYGNPRYEVDLRLKDGKTWYNCKTSSDGRLSYNNFQEGMLGEFTYHETANGNVILDNFKTIPMFKKGDVVKVKWENGWHKIKEVVLSQSRAENGNEADYVLDNGKSVREWLVEGKRGVGSKLIKKDDIISNFSILDDTKDVLRAGGKLAGNIVKDTLYNGGILMF